MNTEDYPYQSTLKHALQPLTASQQMIVMVTNAFQPFHSSIIVREVA